MARKVEVVPCGLSPLVSINFILVGVDITSMLSKAFAYGFRCFPYVFHVALVTSDALIHWMFDMSLHWTVDGNFLVCYWTLDSLRWKHVGACKTGSVAWFHTIYLPGGTGWGVRHLSLNQLVSNIVWPPIGHKRGGWKNLFEVGRLFYYHFMVFSEDLRY